MIHFAAIWVEPRKEYNFFNIAYKGRVGAAQSVENWQILSPIRDTQAGVDAINRRIQRQFRHAAIELSARTGYMKRIPKPAGPQGILWGDKVINLVNSGRRDIYPYKENKYVANGDLGIVVGQYKTKNRKINPRELEVEFSSQAGYAYKYKPWEFDSQESSPPLELAYALTVHKSQGSEFGTTYVVVPNPCRLLSREMLYTSLTRHSGKIVIFHQGDFRDIQRYSNEQSSEISKRMTNLFNASEPCEVKFGNKSVFLDKNLIYKTDRGELVRSKSDWIIADKLHAAGVDYMYEHPLKLNGYERFPDFTIVDDDSGEVWYWEHNGMLSDKEYAARWERKLKAYKENGILPLEDGGGENGPLIVTEEREGHGLDADEIKKYIDLMI